LSILYVLSKVRKLQNHIAYVPELKLFVCEGRVVACKCVKNLEELVVSRGKRLDCTVNSDKLRS
jgi:hypothetical protein